MNKLPPLPEPAAEVVMDLCADHQGPVEACEYLPADTMLYTAEQMHTYALAARTAALDRAAGWTCPKCGTDRTKAACPKGHSAALTGDCPMGGIGA